MAEELDLNMMRPIDSLPQPVFDAEKHQSALQLTNESVHVAGNGRVRLEHDGGRVPGTWDINMLTNGNFQIEYRDPQGNPIVLPLVANQKGQVIVKETIVMPNVPKVPNFRAGIAPVAINVNTKSVVCYTTLD